jgi:hypothetical protein
MFIICVDVVHAYWYCYCSVNFIENIIALRLSSSFNDVFSEDIKAVYRLII